MFRAIRKVFKRKRELPSVEDIRAQHKLGKHAKDVRDKQTNELLKVLKRIQKK